MAAFEVIALDTATPQLRAPGASDTYTFPRAVEMPLGTANGVLYLNGSKVVTSGSGLVFDSSGNLGLGVTPSAWSTGKAVEVGSFGNALYSFSATNLLVTSNAYFNSGFKYGTTAVASAYQQDAGVHKWLTAPSGTAGNAISFTQAMTLDASGNLGVGTTSPGARLHVAGEQLIQPTTAANAKLSMRHGSVANNNYFEVDSSGNTIFGTVNAERARITSGGNFVVGTAALATTATDGFLYVPTCAGTPTGTPTTQTGTAPIVVDTTNNKLYFYSGGQWRDAGP